MSVAICSTSNCGREVTNKKRGLCRRCYERWRVSGRQLPCQFAGCDRYQTWKGHCRQHYRQLSAGQPLTPLPGRGRRGEPRGIRRLEGTYVTGNGYRRIRLPNNRWVNEHRHVMEQTLGRELLPGENVHHRNGDRLDNRPENLELWVTRQPHGQRVKDVLAWAHEIIARYDSAT